MVEVDVIKFFQLIARGAQLLDVNFNYTLQKVGNFQKWFLQCNSGQF